MTIHDHKLENGTAIDYKTANKPMTTETKDMSALERQQHEYKKRLQLEAAAPDLLAACRDALEASVDASAYPDGPCLEKYVRDALKAAIAKAEGQPTSE